MEAIEVLKYANINNYNLLEKIKEEENRLTQNYSNSNFTKEEFYKKEMIDFSKIIVRLIIEDYGYELPVEVLNRLKNLYENNNSIVIIDKSEFPETRKDGQIPSAFARHEEGKVYFPKYDNSDNFIEFVRKQKQTLIHEIFHIVTKNNLEKQNFVYNGEVIGTYKPGAIFNEALVEKSTRDFATRHNLLYHPVVSYIPIVKNLEKFMEKYNIKFNNQIFNIDFNEIIKISSEEEQQDYYDYEQKQCLKKYGIQIADDSHIEIPQSQNNKSF